MTTRTARSRRNPETMTAEEYRLTAETEAQIQAAIVDALIWEDYVVETTSGARRKCLTCGEFDRRGNCRTEGTPDLLVGKVGSPLRLGLEVKTMTGKLRPAQIQALAEGRIVVVRSVDDAMDAVKRHFQEIVRELR